MERGTNKLLCPNENVSMQQVAVPSKFGQKVIVDQCASCGGLWFDAFELYKVNADAAGLLEGLDADSLRTPSEINHPVLLCPYDKAALYRFEDSRFPGEIILMRCPKCQGFWLNRGEFTRFQEVRKNLKQPKEKTLKDRKLDEQVQRILDKHKAKNHGDGLASLGSFLSTPVGERAILPMKASEGFSENDNVFNAVLNALMLILRVFILK